MRLKTKHYANKAKEQNRVRVERLVYEFSSKFELEGAVAAWDYYSALDVLSRRILRSYRSSDGVLDFSAYLKKVQDSRPCGAAVKIEKLFLLSAINQELSSLPPRERTSYLNGRKLTLEV